MLTTAVEKLIWSTGPNPLAQPHPARLKACLNSGQDLPQVHGQLPIRSPSGAGRHAGLFIIDQAPAPANVNKYPGLVGLTGVRS